MQDAEIIDEEYELEKKNKKKAKKVDSKSIGKEYQVVKKGREYHGFWEEYNVEKGKGEAISSSIILRPVGRISFGEKGFLTFGKENPN